MIQSLSIIFFFLDFFNFCCVFQKFPFFYVTLYFSKYTSYSISRDIDAWRNHLYKLLSASYWLIYTRGTGGEYSISRKVGIFERPHAKNPREYFPWPYT